MFESPWISFWETVLVLGLGSYFVLVLFVIPFGFRDVVRLFQSLDRDLEHTPSDDGERGLETE